MGVTEVSPRPVDWPNVDLNEELSTGLESAEDFRHLLQCVLVEEVRQGQVYHDPAQASGEANFLILAVENIDCPANDHRRDHRVSNRHILPGHFPVQFRGHNLLVAERVKHAGLDTGSFEVVRNGRNERVIYL